TTLGCDCRWLLISVSSSFFFFKQKTAYEITEGHLYFEGEEVTEMGADERAQRGLFLAFQYPHAIPGVTVTSFLRSAINAVRKARNGGVDDPIAIPEFRKELLAQMHRLRVSRELAWRYLRDG